MQLNLFEDNRPGILFNTAHECIQAGDFDRALSVYEQLADEYPRDRQAADMVALTLKWRGLLAPGVSGDLSRLHLIWRNLGGLTHAAIKTVALETLTNDLSAFAEAESIYMEPDFHVGKALMESGRFPEAAACFCSALSTSPSLPRGRFLAWAGDALSLAGDEDEALASYLTAFLEDPHSVDLSGIKNSDVRFLYTSLSSEGHEDMDECEIPGWLPVWGWLHDIFPLMPSQSSNEESEVVRYETLLKENPARKGRIWFEMLGYSERLRNEGISDQRRIGLRRLMKDTNPFLFDCYLERIETGCFSVVGV